MFLQASDLESFPDEWSGKSEPTLTKDASLLKAQVCLIINPIILPVCGGYSQLQQVRAHTHRGLL